MTRTYAILDDDQAFGLLLKKKLEHFSDLECVGIFADTISAASNLPRLRPDILFLDMEIDNFDGLEILEVLEVIDHQLKTIVISSSTDYMKKALSFEVYDYIQKPIPSIERLEVALSKVE